MAAFAAEMMPIKKPLLDSSWLLFHRFSWISKDFMRFHGFNVICISKGFMRFHEISWITGVGGFAASADVCHRDDAPGETFTRFQLAAFSSIFIDFRGFHEISWISCIFYS